MKYKITRKGEEGSKYKWPTVGIIDLTGEKPRISIKVDDDLKRLIDNTSNGKFLGLYLFEDRPKADSEKPF